MKAQSLVSVSIRTLNSAKTLEETLRSVKDQTYTSFEIIVSDGHSNDNTVEIAKKYGALVHYVDKLGDARYEDYKISRGKYLFSLDSDQILDKKVIEKCVELCEKKGFDAVTISEQSIIQKGTLLEKLIAYDKWIIDQNRDADATFGTACPRFFKRELFDTLKWPKGLAVFDDTILYAELLKNGAKVAYLSEQSIRHHEVTSWIVFFKKFIRYGRGYSNAFKSQPSTIAAHSLPRKSYFSKAAMTKPHYFLGLIVLYIVKAIAASIGVLSSACMTLRQFLVFVGDLLYYKALEKELAGAKTVLDVGCGSWSPLANVKKTFYSVGIDIHKPSIEEIKKQKIHDEYKVGDVLKLNKIFKPKSFDAVVALDVVEHFEKKESMELIKQMESIAKNKVIILTPFGFVKQHPVDDNLFQEHKSGWSIKEFDTMGYRLRGIRGFRFIRGEYATIKYKPWFLWGIISTLSQFLVYNFPQLAYQLLAAKEMKK